MLNSRREENSFSFLIYGNNTVIGKTGGLKIQDGKLSDDILRNNKEENFLRYGGYIVYTVQSALAPWRYVYAYPQDMLMVNTVSNNLYIIISAVLALIVGFLLSVYFTIRNYNPLLKIVKSIGKVTSGPILPDKKQSEFQLIEDSINSISKEKDKIMDKLNMYKPVIEMNIFITKYFMGLFAVLS